jgi:lycopene beta-cyclase
VTGQRFDVILVGGGLAASLVALALRRRQPRLRMAMVEAGPALGGNHTWSFHVSDVSEEGAALLAPLVTRRWPAVEVAFPDHQRVLPSGYATILSTSLQGPVRAALQTGDSRLILGRRATRITARQVVLDDEQQLDAPLVLDCRGPAPTPTWVEGSGFQKFLGQELAVTGEDRAFAPGRALVMDARVSQDDGLRFMYVLPLGPGRLLVEDTAYSDGPQLDRALLRTRIHAYLRRHGVQVISVLREEEGVLSLPFSDDTVPPLGSPLRLGARGGWFHPTTGYTLPFSTSVALALAERPLAQAAATLRVLYRKLQRQARFYRRLNRMLFRAMEPASRWRLLSRFYRMPPASIARFYAMTSTPVDRGRILAGRPPEGLSLRGALSSALQAA